MNVRQKEIAFEKIFKPIKKLVGSVCWKHYHFGTPPQCPECKDCEGRLYEGIIKDDFKIIRKFEGNRSRIGTEIFQNLFEIEGQVLVRGRNKSKFSTYLISVLNRKIIDEIRKDIGQWRPSNAARKLGACAEKLENFIWAGMNLEEAHKKLITVEDCKNISFEKAKEIESKIRKKTKYKKIKGVEISHDGKVSTKKRDSEEQVSSRISIEYKSDLTEYLVNKHIEKSGSESSLLGVDEKYESNPLTNLEEKERPSSSDENKQKLASYIDNLPENDKHIFNNTYFEYAKASQIAKELGETTYFVQKRIEHLFHDLKNFMT